MGKSTRPFSNFYDTKNCIPPSAIFNPLMIAWRVSRKVLFKLFEDVGLRVLEAARRSFRFCQG